MAQGVVALEPPEVVGWGSIGQAMGGAGGDVESNEDPQAIFEIAHGGGQGGGDRRRQIPIRSAQAMAPHLLAVVQVQALEGLLHGLMASKTGPLVMPSGGAHPRQLQIGPGLIQPVGGTIDAERFIP
jgi:hypothetical protein